MLNLDVIFTFSGALAIALWVKLVIQHIVLFKQMYQGNVNDFRVSKSDNQLCYGCNRKDCVRYISLLMERGIGVKSFC